MKERYVKRRRNLREEFSSLLRTLDIFQPVRLRIVTGKLLTWKSIAA